MVVGRVRGEIACFGGFSGLRTSAPPQACAKPTWTPIMPNATGLLPAYGERRPASW